MQVRIQTPFLPSFLFPPHSFYPSHSFPSFFPSFFIDSFLEWNTTLLYFQIIARPSCVTEEEQLLCRVHRRVNCYHSVTKWLKSLVTVTCGASTETCWSVRYVSRYINHITCNAVTRHCKVYVTQHWMAWRCNANSRNVFCTVTWICVTLHQSPNL